MNEFIVLIIITIGFLIFKMLKRLLSKEAINEQEESFNKIYSKKKLLTDTEIIFYNYLIKLDQKYIVLPQINLASIVSKNIGRITYQNELFRNIDFCIFDENFEVLLAIEINDNTHKDYRRKIRDNKVKKILEECGIELLTYNVQYQNTEESVLERTLNKLNDIVNKNN